MPPLATEDDIARNTAAYNRMVAWLRHTRNDLTDEQIDKLALEEVPKHVYGFDFKRDDGVTH